MFLVLPPPALIGLPRDCFISTTGYCIGHYLIVFLWLGIFFSSGFIFLFPRLVFFSWLCHKKVIGGIRWDYLYLSLCASRRVMTIWLRFVISRCSLIVMVILLWVWCTYPLHDVSFVQLPSYRVSHPYLTVVLVAWKKRYLSLYYHCGWFISISFKGFLNYPFFSNRNYRKEKRSERLMEKCLTSGSFTFTPWGIIPSTYCHTL